MTEQGRECPTENELLARVAGTLSRERVAAIDAHIDACSSCRMVLAEAARGADEIGLRSVALATFAPNESVAGRYVIRRRLAAGGMGEVYEAHDTWLDELIAIKTVVPTIADNELALARLKAEMRLARRVTHRNVCRVYDLGFHKREREQIAFLTMELVRGTTLRRRLDAHGPFDPAAAAPLVEQMVAALEHAHAAGIVHRDLKPDNVMLVESDDGSPDRVVVMDFGLARMALVPESQPLTPNSHTVLGTLDYMSPEQVQGKHAGPASDVYSLGVLIYELLTGELPFQGETPLARALLRVTDQAPSLSGSLPTVDPAWAKCVARCLEPNPSDRFEAVGDIFQALPDVRRGARSGHAPKRRVSMMTVVTVALGVTVTVIAVGRNQESGVQPPVDVPSPVKRAGADTSVIAAVPRDVASPATRPAPPDETRTPENTALPPAPKRPTTKRRSADADSVPGAAKSTEAPTAERPKETKDPPPTVAFQDQEPKKPASGNALLDPFAAGR